MYNFYIVLFKNKVRKKIIKKFIKYENADKFFNKKIEENKEIIFEKKTENGIESDYEIGLVSLNSKKDYPTYLKDEFGRNLKIKTQDSNMSILKISKYKIEELVFDLDSSKKISINQLLKKYLPKSTIKLCYHLNNKIIIQNDNTFNIFSLKNEDDCIRLIEELSSYFYNQKRTDCLFVKDNSSAQKKYLIKLLSDNGIDKKILYRKYTTFPRSSRS